MRLAFYTSLLLAVLLFWAMVYFMVMYFVSFASAYGTAAVVLFGGWIAFVLVALGIGRFEASQ